MVSQVGFCGLITYDHPFPTGGQQTNWSKQNTPRWVSGCLFWNCITDLILPTSYLEKKLSQSSHSRNLQRPPWLASCSIHNAKVKPIIVRKYGVVLTDLKILSCSGRHIPVVEDCLCSEYLTHRKELRVQPPRLPNSSSKNWLLRTRFPTEGFTLGKRKGHLYRYNCSTRVRDESGTPSRYVAPK